MSRDLTNLFKAIPFINAILVERYPNEVINESYIQQALKWANNYCNFYCDEVPCDLYETIASMAADYACLDIRRYEVGEQAVTSLTEGDTKITFGSNKYAKNATTASIILEYREHLNQFRRLKW